jgi:endonuclease-3
LSSRAEEIITRLLNRFERTWHPSTYDPFKSLVGTILSQNTNGRNRSTAHNRLEEMIGITPKNLADASLETITEAIRPAGMYNKRSKVLKRVSEEVLERFNGTLDDVMKKPFPDAREDLMSLPGVGPKTADVVLMFVAGRRIVPVDRHIFRISKRLGIVPEKASYGDVRGALEEASSPDRREDVHVFLIQFGRETCKAQRPLCHDCFIEDLCPYPGKNVIPRKRS